MQELNTCLVKKGRDIANGQKDGVYVISTIKLVFDPHQQSNILHRLTVTYIANAAIEFWVILYLVSICVIPPLSEVKHSPVIFSNIQICFDAPFQFQALQAGVMV